MEGVGAKRARVDTPGSSPPPQMRRAPSDLSASGPTPDAFMLKFQNEALNTKVNDQKREIAELNNKIDIIISSNQRTDAELGYVRTYWSALSTELKNLAPRVGLDVPIAPPKFEQLLWHTQAKNEGDIDENLRQLSDFTRETVDTIARAIEKIVDQNEDILQRLGSSQGGDSADAAQTVAASANTRCAAAERALDTLQQELRDMSQKLSEASNAALESEKYGKRAEEECRSLSDQLRQSERRVEKLEKEVHNLKNNSTTAPGTSTPVAPVPAPVPVRPSIASPAPGLPPKKIKDFAGGGGGGGVSNEQFDVLNQELAEARDIAESRLEQLNHAREEVRNLQLLLTDLETQGTSEEKVRASPIFQNLQFVAAEQRKELGNLYSVADRLSGEVNALAAQRKSEFDRLEMEYQDRLRAMGDQLDEAMDSLARARSERDDLDRKLCQVDFSRHMATAREAATMAETTKNRMNSEMEDKRKKIQFLEKARADLESQLRQVTNRLHDTDARANQLAVRVREHEGVIAMMSRPDHANAGLEHSHKQALGDLEAAQGKIAALEKEVDDIKITCESAAAELEGQKSENEALLSEIEAMSRSCEETEEQNRRLLQLVSEKEDSSANLMQERLRNKKRMSDLEGQVNVLQSKTTAQDAVLAEQKAHMATLEKASKVMKEQTAKYADAERALQGSRQDLIRQVQGGAEQAQRLDATVQNQVQQLNEYKKRLEDGTIQLEEVQGKVRQLEEEAAGMRRKLDKAGGGNKTQDLMSSVLEEELKEMKRMVKCTVCMERNKSVVITKCFHVFCKPCIDANLQTRHRKCPACGDKFGQADTRQLFLV